MKIAAYAFSAALLGFMSITPASALPAAGTGKTAIQAQADGVQLVDHRRDHRGHGFKGKRHFKGKHHGHNHRFRAGGRYDRAPRGWKRYGSRPSYWQTRGCIVVGPVWFCP